MWAPTLSLLLQTCASFALYYKMDGVDITYTISILGEIEVKIDNLMIY